MMKPTLLTIAITLVGCSSGPSEIGQSSSAILDGASESTNTAVGILLGFNMGSTTVCTGTLIAHNLVLTAAHCLAQEHVNQFGLGPGQPTPDNLLPPGSIDPVFNISDSQVHPNYSDGTCPHRDDLALVRLSASPSGVRPLSITATTPAINTNCIASGYGMDSHHQLGARRYGYVNVASVDPLSIRVTRSTTMTPTGLSDMGDSGGPLLCNGLVVGVTSCHDIHEIPHVNEFYTPIDLNWIHTAAAQLGSNCLAGDVSCRPDGYTLQSCDANNQVITTDCRTNPGTNACVNNSCTCTAPPPSCTDASCGTVTNACGQSINCGTCGPGQVCVSNGALASCCTPRTRCHGGCGIMDDGCGGEICCGTPSRCCF